nr:hypothetical protein [Limosilactobacillus mucosae]
MPIIVEIILFLAILALDHVLADQTERFLDQLKQLNRLRYQSWLKLNAIFTGLNILLLILVGWQLFKEQYASACGISLIVLLGDTLKWHRIRQTVKN